MRATGRRKSWLAIPVLWLSAIGPGGCRADGLIGGDCAEGYAFCGEECISITDDEVNCGGCDIACPRRLACIDALCGGPDGDITVDGSGGLGMGGDVSGGGAGGGFGGIDTGASNQGGDGGTPDGNGGSGDTGGSGGSECLPPFVTAAACGDCDTQCGGATPNCAPDGSGGYECVATCIEDPYTTLCADSCVDTETDPRHCGFCNNRCPSGICSAGECVGKVSGHIVAMCMSYEQPSTSQTNLLANSIFLPANNPVRILAYVRDTSAASKAGTNASLVQAGIAKGRSFVRTDVTSLTSVSEQLDRGDFDVLLVYDQQDAPSGRMETLGTNWAEAIETFTTLGGVVVVLTGGGGTSEMHEFLNEIGAANINATSDYTGGTYVVSAPGDAVGVGVVSPYLGVPTSCTFEIPGMPPSELIYVTTAADAGPSSGEPGVLHRIVTP